NGTNYATSVDFSSLSQNDLDKVEKLILQNQNTELEISSICPFLSTRHLIFVKSPERA
ncbi:hypothetical protein H5998_12550, partial [Massilimicrobiota timonensis]|nr:hypothetical protein [Massilimicrobiota timonensis]